MPPGNAAARRSKRVDAGAELAGHGRDEVLDRGGPLEPQEPRHPHGARLADPAEVVAQDVDDHHVLGLVLGLGEQLAGQRPVLVPCPAPRARALDRVGRTRCRRRRPRGTAPARPTAGRAARRWRARGRGPGSPRTAPGRRCAGAGRAATGRRRTGPRAAGSGWPGRSRRGRWPTRTASTPSIQCRSRASARRTPTVGSALGRTDPTVAAAASASTAREHLAEPRRRAAPPSPSTARAASHASPVAPVPGDRPVVQREPEDRQVLVHAGDRRQPLEPPAEVVAEVADEPARERRRSARRRPRRRRPAAAAPAPRRTGRRPRTARPAPRGGRRSGSSSARSAPAARSRAGRGPAGRGTPRRRPSARRRRARRRAHHDRPSIAGRRGRGATRGSGKSGTRR